MGSGIGIDSVTRLASDPPPNYPYLWCSTSSTSPLFFAKPQMRILVVLFLPSVANNSTEQVRICVKVELCRLEDEAHHLKAGRNAGTVSLVVCHPCPLLPGGP